VSDARDEMSRTVNDPHHRQEFAGMNFSQLHIKGAERFGFDWLRANEIVTDAAYLCGWDLNEPAMKMLLSVIAWRMCQRFKGSEAEPSQARH
jgi:hypothetical protein